MIKMVIYFYIMFYCFMMIFFLSMFMYFMDLSVLIEWLLFSMNSFEMEIIIMLDWVSLLFVSFILLISSKIMWYSISYMSNDKLVNRFIWLMLLFILSMVIMIISPNILSIMFGWDGLGLISFCLVIYYQNFMSYNSGMVTMLCNRVGDIGILMTIGMMMMKGSWSMMMFSGGKIELWMLMIAMLTKSAQIPFSSWLPMAMAAPTPVSALVHSSTLVTSGVYLMIRFNNFYMKDNFNLILMYLAVFTMFMSGIMANVEIDLKKIIALSTLSQLGLMMMILSIGEGELAFYHLLMHAIFKSLMFMCAGIMIHMMLSNQDIRLLGNIYECIPVIVMMFMVSNLALCGFPFMAGFYSKDLIMEMIFSKKLNIYMLILIIISLMLTVMYSFRMLYYLFWGDNKFYSYRVIKSSSMMNMSMILLMLMSIMMGSLINWLFFFDYYIIYLKFKMKILVLIFCLLGLIVGMMLNIYVVLIMKDFYYLVYYFSSMWFMDYLFMWIYKPLNLMSMKLNEVDKVWVEYIFKEWFLLIMIYMKIKNFYNIYMFMYLFIMFMWMFYILY